jgi:hypothetical protein
MHGQNHIKDIILVCPSIRMFVFRSYSLDYIDRSAITQNNKNVWYSRHYCFEAEVDLNMGHKSTRVSSLLRLCVSSDLSCSPCIWLHTQYEISVSHPVTTGVSSFTAPILGLRRHHWCEYRSCMHWPVWAVRYCAIYLTMLSVAPAVLFPVVKLLVKK